MEPGAKLANAYAGDMAMNRHIRAAVREDAAGLTRCMQAAYSTYQERMNGIHLPPMDVDYLAEITHYPCWVVESDGIVLGGLVMSFEPDRAAIANIAVDPRFQGQGVGGDLMKYAESKASQQGFTELHLATHVLLAENISLYRHLGWEETARDETRVCMKKAI